MENDFVQIYWTCSNLDEARLVSRALVEKRLVACANIIPWVESVFLWDDQIDTCQETKVIFKTTACLFEAVKEFIISHTHYEIPEILMISITGGNRDYLEWVAQNTSSMR